MRPRDLSGSHDAIAARHGAIHKNDPWIQGTNHLDCLRSAIGLADDMNAVLIVEKSPETSPHEGVIVDQQDCDLALH